jgi:uncharacterized protein YbjT (DUF2867 family)
MKTALVAGATGLVGQNLVRLLLADTRYERVISLVRRAMASPASPRDESVVVDYERLEDFADSIHADEVFCCLGTTIRKAGSKEALRRVDFDYALSLARIARCNGAGLFSLVSSVGASPDASAFYLRVKGELEEAVAALGYSRLHLFRPSFLVGERSESRPGEELGILATRALSPLMRGPLRKYRPIDAAGVARVMVRCAQDETPGRLVYSSDRIQENLDSG